MGDSSEESGAANETTTKHYRVTLSRGLSKYGPWGYLILGMLLCGGALLLCVLWGEFGVNTPRVLKNRLSRWLSLIFRWKCERKQLQCRNIVGRLDDAAKLRRDRPAAILFNPLPGQQIARVDLVHHHRVTPRNGASRQ